MKQQLMNKQPMLMNPRSIQTGLLTFQSNSSTDRRKRDLERHLGVKSTFTYKIHFLVLAQYRASPKCSGGNPVEFLNLLGKCTKEFGVVQDQNAVIPPVSFVCLTQPNDFETANEIILQPSSKSSLSVRRIFQVESLRTIFDERQFHLSPCSHTLGSPQGKLFVS
jgi:hypothetical protein